MKTSGLTRYALLACCVAIASCSQATQLSPTQYAPNVSSVRERSAAYSVLYSFKTNSDDGGYPAASLVYLDGALYGTTEAGGAYYGAGTVFSVTTAGTEQVLHSFGSGDDGNTPTASLLNVDGTLYGTTEYGGTSFACSHGSPPSPGCGIVFSITVGGVESVLHNFGEEPDGQEPLAGLINVDGTLFGTTEKGGTYGVGTVFSITTAGAENVLYSFGAGSDGRRPAAGLIDVNGTLFGTTSAGGAYHLGTVFSVTTTGTEKMLHSFGKGTDGRTPDAGLTDVKGTLYGTTSSGGSGGCFHGCGTVFSITTAGNEKVLHNFGDGTDGATPYAGLIDVKGILYGTTSGGSANHGGTIFSITTGGSEKVLHGFGQGNDGEFPLAGLANVNGSLYGTTAAGGTYNFGTVFTLSP
jgi:uncharacterized repeat protein (TIGR03803 family)